MVELFVFGALLVGGMALMAVLGFVFLLLKIVLWVVFFPIRILFKLLMVPVWLTVGALGLAAGAIAAPVLLVALAGVALVGIVAALLALLLPAVPFILLGLMLWAIFRQRPAVA